MTAEQQEIWNFFHGTGTLANPDDRLFIMEMSSRFPKLSLIESGFEAKADNLNQRGSATFEFKGESRHILITINL